MIGMTNNSPAGLSTKYGPFSGIQAVTSSVNPVGAVAPSAVSGGVAQATVASPGPMAIFIGAIGLLLLLKYGGELESTAIRPAHIQIGGYNAVTISVIAVIGITTFKYVFNRWQIPGITPLVNAV